MYFKIQKDVLKIRL